MSTQRLDLNSLFNKYCEWQSHNNRGVQIGIYSIAIIGLTVSLRRVRPFTKFTSPRDIPKSYITNRREITGFVERIEPNGAVLMVNHKPIIRLPFFQKHNETLPVKIANVEVSGLGISWLQSIVSNNEVTFVPLSKYSQYLLCEVNLLQVSKNKKQMLDLGESLMSIGFGKFEQRPLKVNDIMHKIYIDRLKYAEENYIKREMGLRYYVEPTKTFLVTTIRMITRYTIIKTYKILVALLTKARAKAKSNKALKEVSINT